MILGDCMHENNIICWVDISNNRANKIIDKVNKGEYKSLDRIDDEILFSVDGIKYKAQINFETGECKRMQKEFK